MYINKIHIVYHEMYCIMLCCVIQFGLMNMQKQNKLTLLTQLAYADPVERGG